ncbi:MAG TPA: hypothetical protein VE549_09155, partial [Myxococcaceae bacterium]|nr:hypothetical protein [Myxococcaceae bacterium]
GSGRANTSADTSPADSSVRSRPRTPAQAPNQDELLRRIDRLEKLLRSRTGTDAPPETAFAFLKSYRTEAHDAVSPEDRRELAGKLQKFEQKFVTPPREGDPR